MRVSKSTLLFLLFFSLSLLWAGFFNHGRFIVWALPKVTGLKYQSTHVGGQFLNALLFGLTFALIPMASFVIWKYGPVISALRRVLTIAIIVLSVFLGLYARQQWVKSHAVNTAEPTGVDSFINMDQLHFENYMFCGLTIGSVLSFFLLRQTKRLKTAAANTGVPKAAIR
jgi:hypothetical protein